MRHFAVPEKKTRLMGLHTSGFCTVCVILILPDFDLFDHGRKPLSATTYLPAVRTGLSQTIVGAAQKVSGTTVAPPLGDGWTLGRATFQDSSSQFLQQFT